MSRPKISVILPVYNGMRYLRESVDSILNQSFVDFELIIIEDCSTDGTKSLVKGYEKEYPQIKAIYHEENQGLGRSLNDGLKAATGKYIARQDADDRSMKHRFKRQVELLDTHPHVSVVSSWVRFMDDKSQISKKRSWWIKQIESVGDDPDRIRDKMLEMNIFVHSSIMFRRRMIAEVGLYREDMVPAEDYDYWLRMMDHYDGAIIPDVLCLYRHHDDQLSTRESALRDEKVAQAQQRAREKWKRLQ